MAAAWTLVLAVMGLGLARARAVPTTTRNGCNTGMFKSLLPGELVAFKKEKEFPSEPVASQVMLVET